MAKPQANNDKNDFNPEALLKHVEGHSTEINTLKERIFLMEEKFGDHEKTVNTLCRTVKESTKINDMFGDSFLKLLSNNEPIKNSIITIINKSDRNAFYSYVKKIGWMIWTALTFVLGAVITVLIQRYTK